jgi:predicted  nucleic acid-binding Zn-ribbon protein
MNKNTLYDNLFTDVNEIIDKTDKLEVIHNSISPIKDKLTERLSQHRDTFVERAKEAKELTEDKKYTIAFFGETNAGKSTIIETLRILGNEKTKVEEYAIIESVQSDIKSFQTKVFELQQSIGNAEEKLIHIDNSNKKLYTNKEDNSKHIKKLVNEVTIEQESLSRLEKSLKEIDKRYKSIEKNLFIARQQDEKIKNEIEREKEHLQQKLKSLSFRILRWIKNIFNKEHLIDETRLDDLKVKEFESTQALNELNTILFEQNKNRADLKFKLDDHYKRVEKLKEQIVNLSNDNKRIDNELKLLYEKELNLQATIKDNYEQINKFEIKITELTAKLEELGDGRIIGTGVQDFTQGVHYYELNYKNQPIVLIDIPGIEGNEDRFTTMIKRALIKAHAIFYINGSDKKPEEKTLEKIKHFLRDQTEVYSISNIRGNADSYEFDEDREKLSTTHKDLEKNAVLTKEVLRKVLQDKYKGHLNVQGLLAFLSCTKYINPLRKDFQKSHNKILNLFGNRKNIQKFSNIHSIEQLIIEQQPFAATKIQIANLQTLIGVSSRFADDITQYQEQALSHDLIEHVAKEFSGYQNEVKINKDRLRHSLKRTGSEAAEAIINRLREFLYKIIDKQYEEAYDLFK